MKVTLGPLVDLAEMPSTKGRISIRPWTREQIQNLPRNKALTASLEGNKREASTLGDLWRHDVPKVLPNAVGFTRTIPQDDGHYLVYLAIKDKLASE